MKNMMIKKEKMTDEILKKIMYIDEMFYNEKFSFSYYRERYSVDSILYCLYDDNKLVGYITKYGIKESLYNDLIKGLYESDFEFNVNLLDDNSNYIYISSIIILNEYRKKGYGNKLLEKILSEKNKKYVAMSITEDGFNLLNSKMNFVKKVTEEVSIFEFKNNLFELTYEKINNDNIKLATSIQYSIFPLGCAYEHYRYSIDSKYKDSIYYIIKWKNMPVGITGLYLNNIASRDSIWLGWYGILPEFRSKGIGRQSLLDTIEMAKKYDRKYFRLYTIDDGTSNMNFGNNRARNLYRSIMHSWENYYNINDCNYDGDCLIYSYCLVDKELELWNNRYANINEDEEKEKKAIKNWKDSFKLLILTELNDNNFFDIAKLATSFREDGHQVFVLEKNAEINRDSFDFIVDDNPLFEKKNNHLEEFVLTYKKIVYQKIYDNNKR